MNQQLRSSLAEIERKYERVSSKIDSAIASHAVHYCPGDRGHLAHNWALGDAPVLSGDPLRHARRVLKLRRLAHRAYEVRCRLVQRLWTAVGSS
jgi:hypothetical protein